MSNIKTVPHCPNCGVIGTVIEARKGMVKLECPKCKYHWKTLSMACKKCGKPNHYVVEGICIKCYSASRKAN